MDNRSERMLKNKKSTLEGVHWTCMKVAMFSFYVNWNLIFIKIL